MTTFYADSSALVKRYVQEAGSDWVQALCDPAAGHVLALAHIGLVEIAAALGIKYRQGALSVTLRDGLLYDLQQDARQQYWLIDVDQALIMRALALTRQYKLRGYDAVHLAAALFLRDTLVAHQLAGPCLLSTDVELLEAARAEGLVTDNPNLHL